MQGKPVEPKLAHRLNELDNIYHDLILKMVFPQGPKHQSFAIGVVLEHHDDLASHTGVLATRAIQALDDAADSICNLLAKMLNVLNIIFVDKNLHNSSVD
jgi:hypothetical protein